MLKRSVVLKRSIAYLVLLVLLVSLVVPGFGAVDTSIKANLTATAEGSTIHLKWTPTTTSTEVLGYYVFRGTESGKYGDPIHDFPKQTELIDSNLLKDVTYYYVVKPIFKNYETGTASNEVSAKVMQDALQYSIIKLTVNNRFMIVDDVSTEIDPGRVTVPIIVNERIMLPISKLISVLGGSSAWNATEKSVIISLNGTKITLTVGSNKIKINKDGKEVEKKIDAPPIIQNDRTYVPLRFIIENLDFQVFWDPSQTVTIRCPKVVAAVNHKPVIAAIGTKAIDEGKTLQFAVTGRDIDNDKITFKAENLPKGAVLNADTGVFTWKPDNTQKGTYNVTFIVTDGKLPDSIDSTIMTINVGDTTTPPELVKIGNRHAKEGQKLEFKIAARDKDNDKLTYYMSAITGTAKGAVLDATTGLFTWVTDMSTSGTYKVRFQVSDGKNTDYEDVTITIGNVNRAPVITAVGPKTVNEKEKITFGIVATDPDNDTISYKITGLPEGADFTIDNVGCTFTWTPDIDQEGQYNIKFFAIDSKNASDIENVKITVNKTNVAPMFNPIGNKTVTEGQKLEFKVVATDIDKNKITFDVSGLPTGATFDKATGAFSWVTGFSSQGSYKLKFTATDGKLTDSEEIYITVGNVNRPPEFTTVVGKEVSIKEMTQLNLNLTATDPDDNTVSYTIENLPTGATFDAKTSKFAWLPTFLQAGKYSIKVIATDGTLATTKDFVIKVENDPIKAEVTATGDNVFEIYLNGSYVGRSNDNWKDAEKFLLNLRDGDNVLGFRVENWYSVAGLLADIRINGTSIGSSKSWKVSKTGGANWSSLDYIDTAWTNATEYGAYKDNTPWRATSPIITNMPDNTLAKWLWTANNTGKVDKQDDVAYFRIKINLVK